jgi:2,4-didehydro-3-deoxy-L-rhamnonate hydrolase
MAINVLRFEYRSSPNWGIAAGDRIILLSATSLTTGEFIERFPVEKLQTFVNASAPELHLSDVRVLSPITGNQQFLCLGANYRQHMIESGMDPEAKSFNMMFTKAASCIVPADSPVIKPRAVKYLDYEVELGLVLKRPVRGAVKVDARNLSSFVAGMVIVNDYSARDIQIPQMQFYKGKSFRTFGPVGPVLCLLTAQEMHYLQDMELQLSVNGQLRQRDNTANCVWGPAETLTELSSIHDLDAGDLIATGTPAGCALSIPSPAKQRIAALLPERIKWRLFLKAQATREQYLKAGDTVVASIRSRDGAIDLGMQVNLVVDEA